MTVLGRMFEWRPLSPDVSVNSRIGICPDCDCHQGLVTLLSFFVSITYHQSSSGIFFETIRTSGPYCPFVQTQQQGSWRSGAPFVFLRWSTCFIPRSSILVLSGCCWFPWRSILRGKLRSCLAKMAIKLHSPVLTCKLDTMPSMLKRTHLRELTLNRACMNIVRGKVRSSE
jgi:hypothetical protein